MSAPAPIFIGGMFKSGTSLLRAMVGRHSQVAAGLETYWFDIDWALIDAPATLERLRVFRDLFDFDAAEFNQLVRASRSSEALLDALMGAWAARQGKPRWAEKTPGNVMHMERIAAYWPHARILHIVRDPRDVFASLREAHKWDTVPQFIGHWSAMFRAAERFKTSSACTPQRYMEVRYENLVTDPMNCMRRLSQWAALEFEEETATFPGQEDDFDKVKRATGRESTTLARLATPLTQERQGIWRRVLLDQEVKELERAASACGLGPIFAQACAGHAP